MTEDQLEEIEAALARDPLAGDMIPGTGGARKVRFPGKGRGKSGGYRTIHFWGGDDVPIFLLACYSKGERADLSQRERNELRAILSTIAKEYRDNVRKRMKRIGK
jgi:hypothetical protein